MKRNLLKEIATIINSNQSEQIIRKKLEKYHYNDIALVVHDLTKEERIKLYHILGLEKVSEIFSYLEDVEDYIEELDVENAADIIELMDVDDAVDVLDELDDDDRDTILKHIDKEAALEINLISSYDEDQVGSLMTTNYIAVNKNSTIKEAMKKVVADAAENDNVTTIFAVNDDETFYGSFELRDLIIARTDYLLEDIIKTSYPVLNAQESISECINDLKDYSLEIIPVLDDQRKILGVITSSDIVETVDEEFSEDYAKLAGLVEATDLDESVFKSIKNRMPWLMVLLFLGLGVSILISGFEDVVKTLPMIVFFQSLILGMAGNAGTQSLAVTIRILAEEDFNKKTFLRTITKETSIGFFNGLILGTVSFIAVFVFLYLTKSVIVVGDEFKIIEVFKASLVVGLSLFGTMMLSTFAGSIIPILFKKIHIDPAVASGPFITTLNDIVAIVIYYGLAWALFIAMF